MKLLLCSHGAMASGIASSLGIIVGDLALIDSIDAYLTDESFDSQLDNYVKNNEELPDLVLTDLYGGSVNQKCTAHPVLGKCPIISGMNLPLALQASLMSLETLQENGLQELIKSSQDELKQVVIEVETDDFDF